MKINIPGRNSLNIEYVLLDYNGTIALDGRIIDSVRDRIFKLNKKAVKVYVLTADTHGTVAKECEGLPVEVKVFNGEKARFEKEKIVDELGGDRCISIGNGYNDCLMIEKSSLGIIVLGREGCSVAAFNKADVICNSIEDAFDLIINEKRLIATLRG